MLIDVNFQKLKKQKIENKNKINYINRKIVKNIFCFILQYETDIYKHTLKSNNNNKKKDKNTLIT